MKGIIWAVLLALLFAPASEAAKPDKSTKSLADLDCSTQQIAKFDGIEWVCSWDETGRDELDSCPCFSEEQVSEVIQTAWDHGGPFDQDCVLDLSVEGLPGPGAFLNLWPENAPEMLDMFAWWYSDGTKVAPYCGIYGFGYDYSSGDLTPRQLRACVEALAEGAHQVGFSCSYRWYSQGF